MKMLKTMALVALSLSASVAFADHHGEAKAAYTKAVEAFNAIPGKGGQQWLTTDVLVKDGAKALEADKLDEVMTISARIEAEVAATLEQARLGKQYWAMSVPR